MFEHSAGGTPGCASLRSLLQIIADIFPHMAEKDSFAYSGTQLLSDIELNLKIEFEY
jgi:hypothetical protein